MKLWLIKFIEVLSFVVDKITVFLASRAASVAQLVEPSLEHRVLCLALCVSDSAQPAELPQ